MRRAWAAIVGAVVCAGCATTRDTQAEKPPRPGASVENLAYFDLASCFPQTLELTGPANREEIVGFLVAARPQVLECLVDPKARGPEKETRVAVDTTVAESGVEHAISGANLTPQGIACVKAELERTPGLKPLPPGTPPVTGHAEFNHVAGVNPTVSLGGGEAADLVATIRLHQKAWCDCYLAWKDAAPRALRAQVQPDAGVTFQATGDPAADQVAGCLRDRLSALPAPAHPSQAIFVTLNSHTADELPNAPPELTFVQLEAVRSQRAAQVAVAMGQRANAVGLYDRLVERWSKDHASVSVPELTGLCQGLLTTDEGWAQALKGQLEIDRRIAAIAGVLKAQERDDPSWAEAETNAQKTVTVDEGNLKAVQNTKKGDASACSPKESVKP